MIHTAEYRVELSTGNLMGVSGSGGEDVMVTNESDRYMSIVDPEGDRKCECRERKGPEPLINRKNKAGSKMYI